MSELNATPGLYPALPTLKLNGREENGLLASLQTMLVEETVDGLFRCELTFLNWGPVGTEPGYLYTDRRLLDFGKQVEILAGAGETEGSIFKGRITGLEGRFPASRPPELTVLAEDRLQDLRMTRRSRSWEDVTDEELFRAVAAEQSLTPQIDVDSSLRHKVAVQVNQTDLAFLRDRARLVDAELWVDGDRLHVLARSKRRGAELTLTYGQRLVEFIGLADLAGQRTKLVVAGWDVASKETITAEAAESAIRAEAGGKLTGGQALSRAFGERAERLVQTVPLTDAEARATAESAFRRMARRFLTGHGLVDGDARIRVGAHVDLQGLPPIYAGKYYVTEARHTFDLVDGYRTHFRVERPWAGE